MSRFAVAEATVVTASINPPAPLTRAQLPFELLIVGILPECLVKEYVLGRVGDVVGAPDYV